MAFGAGRGKIELMGWRFQKRFKIFPGVTLNVTNHGVSITIGFRGAHFTFGSRGTRTTVGLPGTGLSYTEERRRHKGD